MTAPGVTKEVEDAIRSFAFAVGMHADKAAEAKYASLLAAIEKYGNDNWLLGYDNRRDAELEQAHD